MFDNPDDPQQSVHNLRHWENLSHTDPRQTKPFQREGGFRGTAIKPIWNVMRLTEHFGPMGVGWGTHEPKFNVIDTGGESVVFCILECWYIDTHGTDDEKRLIWGIGGDKVLKRRANSPDFVDDDAFKKAYTDAIGNAFLRVGMSADISLGLFEDSKYLAQVREHFDNNRAIQQQVLSPPQSKETGKP